jgi:hypothetical protein
MEWVQLSSNAMFRIDTGNEKNAAALSAKRVSPPFEGKAY